MSERRSLWHGGAPGLEVGAWLLPPRATGYPCRSDVRALDAGLSQITYRPEFVYVTSDRDLAKGYAATWTRPTDGRVGWGWLYRVEVDEADLMPDPDLLSSPGVSFQCRRASIAAIYEKAVQPGQPRLGRHVQRLLAGHELRRQGY